MKDYSGQYDGEKSIDKIYKTYIRRLLWGKNYV